MHNGSCNHHVSSMGPEASDAGHRMPRKILHRCLGNRKIRIFGFSEIRIFGNLEVRKSENPDFRISGNPNFRKSDFRKSGKSLNSDFRIFRFPGFSENRKIQKSGKKASDVEFAYVELPLKSRLIDTELYLCCCKAVFSLTCELHFGLLDDTFCILQASTRYASKYG